MKPIEWIDQEPPEEEISTNKDGSVFQRIAVVESLLDELTDNRWSTRNFKFSLHPYSTTLLVSASIELCVLYRFCNEVQLTDGSLHITYTPLRKRILVGAVTFDDFSYAGNLDFAGTALSEAIKNAAKKLGPRFGKNLNGRGEIKSETPKEKPEMDVVTKQKYKNAVAAGDTKTILEIENYYQL